MGAGGLGLTGEFAAETILRVITGAWHGEWGVAFIGAEAQSGKAGKFWRRTLMLARHCECP